MVADNKTVSGLNRACALTTDHSCLHRWLTEVPWDGTALHDRRLAWLPQAPRTRYRVRGVLAIDHPLVTHEGKLIDDVGWCWEHADARPVIAHDSMLSHDVCALGAPYPSEGRRCKKRETWAATACTDHPQLGIEWSDEALTRGIPGGLDG